MKSIIQIFIILLFFPIFSFAQKILPVDDYFKNKGEIYFKIYVSSKKEINDLSNIISIDEKTRPGFFVVYAYANEREFKIFSELNYEYEILPHPGDLLKEPKILTDSKGINSWDSYPAYQTYIDMMNQYQTDYPNQCEIVEIGQSVNNKKILFAKVTSPVISKQPKPKILYSSTIHGDEPAGYVLLLRLIDYFLSSYGNDAALTDILDKYEIWINPLANPDGTYHGGDNTVSGATRNNANSIDLNRNFPDFVSGDHPDSSSWQAENIAFMNFTDTMRFVLSACMHAGAEVVNYPWDTKPQHHADDSWWQYVSKMYADTAKYYGHSGYMTSVTSSGFTNGYAWYTTHGNRQDFMNYYRHCREFTLEISDTKIPDANTLPALWDANYKSLLNYIKEASNGFSGIVTDSASGIPLDATITIPDHDMDNSFVFSDIYNGNYYRPIFQGTYNVSFSHPGYKTKSVSVNTVNGASATRNVQLSVYGSGMGENTCNYSIDLCPNPVKNILEVKFISKSSSYIEINLVNLHGVKINLDKQNFFDGKWLKNYNLSNFSKGFYVLQIITETQNIVNKIVLE
ncbi:MAG: T9SS type A sorting domain-containing protein [Bacteroidia bacterium]|nr:T9SS type A sorting domain-containing protein [Bacteroidia bacterium]